MHGSYEFKENDPLLQDALWVNDGKGNFSPADLPTEKANGQVVKAADFDGDGDLDLFVGGNVLPRSYPKPDRSFLLRNDTKVADKPIFTDVTKTICPELAHFGIINDAIWSDFDNDNKPDLIIASEWRPITFFKNDAGKLINTTAQTGVGDKIGWWTSLAAADFDNDGDTDYIGGNYGKNVYFKCTSGEPLSIYAKDFDNNGNLDPFISCFWRDTAGNRQEFFYHTRDDMIKQLVLIRRKFDTYAAFGTTPAPKVFTPEELKDALILKANCLESVFLENKGGGKFSLTNLPTAAQLAPLRGMMPFDVDADGLLDLILIGNDYGMELLQGRADAFNGLILKNLGSHKFEPLSLNETGFCVPADARALSFLHRADGQPLILATQNRARLKVFVSKNKALKVVRPQKGHNYADIILKNGQKRRHEFYYGHSFLSQHPLSISIDDSVERGGF
ncbi:MAG: VCBS repeat-containing protein [Saprospiraceae bacterium]|nr:VCBS repeat-containing protein [Saprospiraceae bacterium]